MNETSIRVLAELGAAVNVPDKNGWTPTFVAAAKGRVAGYWPTSTYLLRKE